MYALEELIAEPGFTPAMRTSLLEPGPPPVLREAKIKITSRCNLRCQMCHYWETKTEDTLTTPRWKQVLDELAAMGCRKVHFSGGKVFLRRDFLAPVDHTIAVGMRANMTTNATLIDRERARRMARAGINSVSISLDGPNPNVHDRIRGMAGAFKRSVKTIGWLRRYSEGEKRPLKVRINFVVMNDNFRTLPEMVRLAAELGAVELNPMPVDEKGPRKKRLSRGQIEAYNREIAPLVLDLRREHGFSTAPGKVYPFGVTPGDVKLSREGLYARGFYERHPCLAPWLHAFFAWNGDVFLCCMTNGRMEPLGNARSQSMKAIFHGKPYRRIRRRFMSGQHLPTCHRCDLFLEENARLHKELGPAAEFRRKPSSGAA